MTAIFILLIKPKKMPSSYFNVPEIQVYKK